MDARSAAASSSTPDINLTFLLNKFAHILRNLTARSFLVAAIKISQPTRRKFGSFLLIFSDLDSSYSVDGPTFGLIAGELGLLIYIACVLHVCRVI